MNTTNTNPTVQTIPGTALLAKFANFLEKRCVDVNTPCDNLLVMPFGVFTDKASDIRGVGLVLLEPGGEHPQHMHKGSDAVLLFMEGTGHAILGKEKTRVPYAPGKTIVVPRGTLHGFDAETESLFCTVQSGEPIISEKGEVDIHFEDPRCHHNTATFS